MITPALPTRLIRELAHRYPHLNTAWIKKVLWHYANNYVALSVERNRLVQDACVSSEASLPQTVTQNNDRCCTGLVFIIGEDPTEPGIDAQNWKQIGGNLASDNTFRLSNTSQ